MLGATVTVPLYGRLGDVYGRKPLFIVAISIFLFGSALCGLVAVDAAAGRLPRDPGARRGRDLPADAGDDRDDRPAARPRPLPGADRVGVRGRVDHRAADRRLHRRQPELALDLLRQPADRRRRARGDPRDDAAQATAARALDRLARRGDPRARHDGPPARARLGRARLRLELGPRDRRPARLGGRALDLRARRAARARADPALRPAAATRRSPRASRAWRWSGPRCSGRSASSRSSCRA